MNRWKDWYKQGKRDMERAYLDQTHKFFEWACFTSQQAAEKVVKSLGLKAGVVLWGYSITEMFNILRSIFEVPVDVTEKAQLLDLYYIASRYPNGFAEGKPADYFNQNKSKEALDAAEDIIRFCERRISE